MTTDLTAKPDLERQLDTPLTQRQLATSLGASAMRVSRWIGQPSSTGATRRSAADELDRMIEDAKALKALLRAGEIMSGAA